MTFRLLLICAFALATTFCGSGKETPTSPTPPTTSTPPPAPAPTPTPTPPPSPATYTVAGVVTDATSRAPLGGVTVRIDAGIGLNNTSTTDGNGYYSIPGVAGSITVSFRRPEYDSFARPTVVNGDTRFDVTMTRTAPPWSISGAGNTVFTMPSNFSRVRIQGEWNRTQTSNFIVRIGGRTVVNEILRDSITYDGIHLTNGGGTTEITNSGQIRWTFTEVR